MTRVGTAVNYGLTGSPNIQSLVVYNGELIATSSGLQELVRINETTGVATGVVSGADLPDESPEALVDHGGQLLMAGSGVDALFRLYDVLWDETITSPEIDEGASGTLLDLSTVSQDAVSFSLEGTPPSWLSISGDDLVATNVPDVSVDTDYDVAVRATRDSVNADKTLEVVVRSTGVAVLTFGSETIADQSLSVGDAVNLTLPEATGGDMTIVYLLTPGTLPGGLSFNATTRVLSGTPTGRFTSAEFTYTATDGNSVTVTLTFTIVVTAEAIVFDPTSIADQVWTVGDTIDLTLPSGAGGVGDLIPSLTRTLPTGVMFTSSTRALAGNPSAVFSVATFTYTMTDAEGESESISFTIVVDAEELVATTLVEISGDNQTANINSTLNNTFVVEVSDQNGDALSGATVTFAVISGGGSLSETSVMTGADGQAETALTLGSTAGTNTVTATVSGITGSITFTATATALPLTISVTVPATADLGETVNISATAVGEDTIEWKTTGGSIDDESAAATELTVPSTARVIAVTCVATDADGATASDTAYLTVGVELLRVNASAYQIEIEGVDVTDRWIRRDGLNIQTALDYPRSQVFRSGQVTFNLDNADGTFDASEAANFFVNEGLPAHGRGATVLIRLGDSASELVAAFAGKVSVVTTSLQSTKARFQAHDLSTRLNRDEIEDFGDTLTRTITDFEGAAVDYDALNPVFYFPIWGTPIAPGSVSLTVDGTSVNIVDSVATTGVLSNENAEIDYGRGLIRFEAPPDAAEATQIEAEWKIAYQYKRPDFLARQLLKNTGLQTEIGIADDTDARFAIEQALVRHPSERLFTSHGRPFFEKAGIVRWMMRDADNKKRYMTHDDKLLEYDEHQDEYTELGEFPSASTGVTPPAYGTLLTSESFDLPSTVDQVEAIAVSDQYIFVSDDRTNDTLRFSFAGVQIDTTGFLGTYHPDGLAYYNGQLYGGQSASVIVRIYDAATGILDSSPSIGYDSARGVAVNADGIYLVRVFTGDTFIIHFDFDYNLIYNTEITGLFLDSSAGFSIALSDTHIYLGQLLPTGSTDVPKIFAFNFDASRDASMDITPSVPDGSRIRGLHYYNQRLYVGYTSGGDSFIQVYYIGGVAVENNYVPQRFDSHDFEDFYALCSDTITGNQVNDTSISPVRVIKYDKSADTFATVLDESTGEPQLAHPYTDAGSEVFRADNRKNFQVVRRSNKTLIFYRRVESSQSSIAVKNETDDDLTNIHTTLHSVGDGVPYGMDFGLDIRSDGIHVYSFVVYYDDDDSTLKVYRERFQPSGSQTEIFSETIARVDDSDGNAQYAVSVSDVILNDSDDKWYFVLTWGAEDDGTGKAELCTIAKDGGGSRTVLKTYDDPLLSARSPAEMGSRYFYVEGGWVRPEKTSTDDDVPDEEHHYPDEGGRLIEIESDDSITDHGIIWRSATKEDSPDPDAESEIYDGWGLHNAIVSNLLVDDRDNLHCIAGYGLPYDVENNSPLARTAEPSPDKANFVWLQWGQDLATKIASFLTTGSRAWDLIQELAQLMNWELGFGPDANKVAAVQVADTTISDWSANASLFFRPRTILPGKLRTAITTSGTVTTLAIDDSGLPAEVSEFPDPPSGERYTVVIDEELFTYTGVTPDSEGRELTGVVRAQNGSTAAAHAVDDSVYFVDTFITSEADGRLVSIANLSQDFVNIKNSVSVGYGIHTYQKQDDTSITENSKAELRLSTSQKYLRSHDRVWAELIGDTYLNDLKRLKTALSLTLPFSPGQRVGQLVVVKQMDRVQIDFKIFKVVQVRPQLPQFQTDLNLIEVQ